ncbi:MAG: nucleoside deaminase [Planctomycetota bacterium]
MNPLNPETIKTAMSEAIEIAKANSRAPFGCVLFDLSLNRTVATGLNRSDQNPLHHGEIVAINNYVEQGGRNWSNLSLFTTAEPCCMCQGAILWSGIRQVVFGTSIATLKRQGWHQIDITSAKLTRLSWRTDLDIRPGIMQAECDELFRTAMRLRTSQH